MENNASEVTKINDNISIGFLNSEVRDIMDYTLAEWEKTIKGREVEDRAYSFAYWLFRWSGLVEPIFKCNDGLTLLQWKTKYYDVNRDKKLVISTVKQLLQQKQDIKERIENSIKVMKSVTQTEHTKGYLQALNDVLGDLTNERPQEV